VKGGKGSLGREGDGRGREWVGRDGERRGRSMGRRVRKEVVGKIRREAKCS
jgi:hypothetical protein